MARLTTALKRVLSGRRYQRLNARWEIAEFGHRLTGWLCARRCVVARRKIQETEPEPTLFALDRYLYRAWFTNLPLTPAGVWSFSEGRAGMEPRIRKLREDYALRKIPTRAFAANALYIATRDSDWRAVLVRRVALASEGVRTPCPNLTNDTYSRLHYP